MAKGTGVITFEDTSTYKVETKLNPPVERKAETRKRKVKRVVPAQKPIEVGDTVISRDYFSGGVYRKLFEGTAVVYFIATEMRRDLGSNKTYEINRMTLITREGKRHDILEPLLQLAVSAPKPSPLPAKVEIVNVEPLLLPAQVAPHHRRFLRSASRIKIGVATPMVIELPANTAPIAGLLPALTSHNRATVKAVVGAVEAQQAAEARQRVRVEHEVETGESAPKPAPMDMGRRSQWIERDSKLFKVKVGG